MQFNLSQSIDILSRTPDTLEKLLAGLPEAWLRGTEGENTWSPYEVLGHLIHGEKTDWITRTKIILTHGDSVPFTPFDRFAQFESNQNASLEELLEEFKTLRKRNIEELKSLHISEDQLSLKGMHPDLGEVNLEQLLSTWVVHDLGHIAQISRVMAKQYKEKVGPWINYISVLNR